MSAPVWIDGLELLGVFDRGIPNRERIVIVAHLATDMSMYGLLIGLAQNSDSQKAIPLRDQFFWFGNGTVATNSRIFVYTGQGEFRSTTVSGTNFPAYVVHWEKSQTVFAQSAIVPILIKLGSVAIDTVPANLPQPRQLIPTE